MQSLNTRKASRLKRKKTLGLKRHPQNGGERKREKPFGMKKEKEFEDSGIGVEDRILDLVFELEKVELKVRELKVELKEMVKASKRRRDGLRTRKKGSSEEKNLGERKNSWKVGDSVIVLNAFRYRGRTQRHSRVNGTVTKVTEHWIWFSVHLYDPDSEDHVEENGHYRARHNLWNERWGMC